MPCHHQLGTAPDSRVRDVGVRLEQLLSQAEAKEADGHHRGDAGQRGPHALVKTQKSLRLDREKAKRHRDTER